MVSGYTTVFHNLGQFDFYGSVFFYSIFDNTSQTITAPLPIDEYILAEEYRIDIYHILVYPYIGVILWELRKHLIS